MMAWTWPALHNQASIGLGCNTSRRDGGLAGSVAIDTDRTEKEYNNVSTEEGNSRHELHAAGATVLPS